MPGRATELAADALRSGRNPSYPGDRERLFPVVVPYKVLALDGEWMRSDCQRSFTHNNKDQL